MRQGTAERGVAPGGARGPRPPSADRVLRFRRSERLLHWAIAVPFMISIASAVVLVLFYNPAPQRPLRALFSWVHRLSGACFLAVPILVAIKHRKDSGTYWGYVRECWRWRRDDLKWLLLQGPASIGRKAALPEPGKFNAGQKLNFVMVMCTWPLFVVTGALIWFGEVAFVSWLVHFLVAAIALPLVVGHIYMAVVNPGTRKGLSGMITGLVDRRWVEHHHPRWYRETFVEAKTAPAAAPAPTAHEPPRPAPSDRIVAVERRPHGDLLEQPALIRCSACDGEHEVASWALLLDRFFTAYSMPCPRCGVEMVSIHPVIVDPELLEPILRRLERRNAGRTLKGPAPPGRIARGSDRRAVVTIGPGTRERLALAGVRPPAGPASGS